MPTLIIDSHANADHAARLLRLTEFALPMAARQTLNRAAFDVKQNTMPTQAGRTFYKREPNFLRANSRVDPAKGRSLDNMQSVVGFMNLKPVAVRKVDLAVRDLEEQEEGGAIGGRAFVPLKGARVSGAYGRKVKQMYRTSNLPAQLIDSEGPSAVGKNSRQKFILAARHAGKGGFVIGNIRNGKGARMLLRINSIVRASRTYTSRKTGRSFVRGNTVVNATAIYSVKSGNVAKVKPTHFMRIASLQSAAKMDGYFAVEAEKLIKRYI